VLAKSAIYSADFALRIAGEVTGGGAVASEIDAEPGRDRLMSALEAERGGTRVSEGVPDEDRAAVARVISVPSGHTRHSGAGSRLPADVATLWSRPAEIDGRLDEIVKLLSGLKAEIATVIAHVCDR
jgi:hypothetical protein